MCVPSRTWRSGCLGALEGDGFSYVMYYGYMRLTWLSIMMDGVRDWKVWRTIPSKEKWLCAVNNPPNLYYIPSLVWLSHLVIWKSRWSGIKYTFNSHGWLNVGKIIYHPNWVTFERRHTINSGNNMYKLDCPRF